MGGGDRVQPSHVVYGGAHLFRAGTPRRLGELALEAMDRHGVGPEPFAEALGVPPHLAGEVWARTRAKLEREPVEDYRIDFEDGYGWRPEEEERADAERTARELASALARGLAPRRIGLRPRPVAALERFHGTLGRFLRTLASEGAAPESLVVTLPKPSAPEEVEIAATALERLEEELGWAARSLELELMLETPAALLDAEGRCPLPRLVDAGDGRVRAVHLGAYDLASAVGVPASAQALDHPLCDLARSLASLALAPRGTWLADGATTRLPVGPHRGPGLTELEESANRAAVRSAWALHARHVRGALRQGYVQGWDLHPAQLPARFASLASAFLEDLPEMAARLQAFLAAAGRASRVGADFDDAATARGLILWFRRGLASGLLTGEDLASAGLRPESLVLPGAG